MTYLGELISIGVAFSWTATALLSEFGSKRLGNLTLNVLRMALALLFSLVLFGVVTGHPLPMGVPGDACGWMLLSGLVGYVIGDFCLFQCYIIIGSRFGQLFMTLAPLSAALMAWVTLGQQMKAMSVVAMLVTLFGIGISVLGRGEHHKLSLKLPLNGVLYAIGAAVCQGVGLVLSKIGLDHYTQDLLASEAYSSLATQQEAVLPFASNTIRCVAGLACFAAWLIASGNAGRMVTSLHERKGLAAMLIAVFSGPFIGVGFSLMAVQYTAAGIASTIMAMTPILILLPSRWLFHQPITAKGVVGAVISCIGVSLFFLL